MSVSYFSLPSTMDVLHTSLDTMLPSSFAYSTVSLVSPELFDVSRMESVLLLGVSFEIKLVSELVYVQHNSIYNTERLSQCEREFMRKCVFQGIAEVDY